MVCRPRGCPALRRRRRLEPVDEPGSWRIVSTPHSHASAAQAVELARAGEVESLMKGSLHTDEIMGAIGPSASGVRTSRRISHALVMDVPTYHKMFIMTDATVNIAPTLSDKKDIIQNAINLAHSPGIEKPKVGILSAVMAIVARARRIGTVGVT